LPPLHKREPSLEKILELRELTSIETIGDAGVVENDQEDRVNERVQRMMNEISDLK